MITQVTNRPEIVLDTFRGEIADIRQPLSAFESVYRIGWLRKLALLLMLALIWETCARWLGDPLLFPTFSETLAAFFSGIASGVLLSHAAISLKTLAAGYAMGTMLAVLLVPLAVGTKWGDDLLETLAAIIDPLPAIALLPLALIWFGLGESGLIFLMAYCTLWSVLLNMRDGFRAVSPTVRMVGRNCGLKGPVLMRRVLVPAALPGILKGLRNGWAFAWRTLIAAELVLGASSGKGGLGGYLFQNHGLRETANVFACLFLMVMIGLFVENMVFAGIEKRTTRRWGMHR